MGTVTVTRKGQTREVSESVYRVVLKDRGWTLVDGETKPSAPKPKRTRKAKAPATPTPESEE